MDQQAAVAILVVLGLVLVFLVAVLIVYIFYLLTLQRAMNLTARRNRTMEPGLVWLNLVPILNIYWTIHTAIHVSGTLKNEFRDRRMEDGSDYGRNVGLAIGILNILQLVVSWSGAFFLAMTNQAPVNRPGDFAGVLGPPGQMGFNIVSWIMSLAGLICWIIFWVRIAGYKRQLELDDADFDRDRPDDRDDDRYESEDRSPRPLPDGARSTDIEARQRDDRYST